MKERSWTVRVCFCKINASSSSLGKHPTPVWKNQLMDANRAVMELTAKCPEDVEKGGGRSSVNVCFRWLWWHFFRLNDSVSQYKWLQTVYNCSLNSIRSPKIIRGKLSIFFLAFLTSPTQPGYQVFRASKWLCSPAQITHLSRCGCGLVFVCTQIQTYQVLQEHLAPSTCTAASGLTVNQCKPMGVRGSHSYSSF